MAKAMILAAGFGTRLRPLTLELPKPLVWIGDRPAIALVAERLVAAGVTDLVINTHHHAEAFSERLLARIPGRLTVLVEPEILGTGGGVANAAELLGAGDVIVWNGDILAPLDVGALLAAHRIATANPLSPATSNPLPDATEEEAARSEGPVRPAAGATLAIAPRARGEGTVGVDERGRVARIRGELFGEERSGGDFLGISVIGPELRAALPSPGCLVGDGLLPWLRGGGTVATFPVELAWDDIGSIEAYLRANRRWLSSLGRGAFVGEGAVIAEEVELVESVVGEGATVRGEGQLVRCVVWPGATATAPLADAVVTTAGRVARPGATAA